MDNNVNEKQRNEQNNVKNARAAVDIAAGSGVPVVSTIGKAAQVADTLTFGKATEAMGKHLTKSVTLGLPTSKKTQKQIQDVSNTLAESGVTDAITGAIGAKRALGGNKTSLASPKRANSMIPNHMQGLPAKDDLDSPKKEEQNPQSAPDEEKNNKESSQETNSKGSSDPIQGFAKKTLLNIIKKNPIVFLIIGGFGIFVLGLIFLFAIVAAAAADDNGSGGGSSGGGNSSTSFGSTKTTESCPQLQDKTLSETLAENNSSIDQFNSDLQAAINAAGLKTREAVVVAALGITSDLCDNYHIRLPYLWGGGHSGKITLASGNWGAKLANPQYNNSGLAYPYDGLDCSGFVSWAIYNAGYDFPLTTSEDFPAYGQTYNMASSNFVAKPGDLIHHEGHIIMIVGVDEAAQKYTIAEAAGLKDGMRTTTMDFKGGGRSDNEIIDMSSYYERGVK